MNRILVTMTLLLLVALPDAAVAGRKINLAPSGGDDTLALQAALDLASSGPRKIIRLSEGTFRISRPLLGINSDVVIRGAGMGTTHIIADGSFNADDLFRQEPLGDSGVIQILRSPILFLFVENDTDVAGNPVSTQRSVRVEMKNLTLGARGQTVPHFDVSENDITQRMFSLVWMGGFRGDWTNSAGQTPADIGMIDAEHAIVSTMRATFRNVHFDGRNRDRAATEPGGAYDPNPDVRNGFGIEGGLALSQQPPPVPEVFFKPVNATVKAINCLFSSFPGQAGVFAPQLVGRNDAAWTFGPGAVPGTVAISDTVFEDIAIPVLLPDVSAISVKVTKSALWRSDFGIFVRTNFQTRRGTSIGYPDLSPSKLLIEDSILVDSRLASIIVGEFLGPSVLDVRIKENEFVLSDATQAGFVGLFVDGARFDDNKFSGQGYAGIVALDSTNWRIDQTDFCDLDIPPAATAAFGLPPNHAQAPIVLLSSTGMRVTDSDCASFYQLPEDASNTISDDDDDSDSDSDSDSDD